MTIHAVRTQAPPAPATVDKRRRPVRPGQVVNYVLAAIVVVCYLFPLLFLLNTALKSNAAFSADPIGIVTSPDFGNFATAWTRGNFGAYILNSILYTGAAALIGTFVSVVLGFPVSRGYLRGSKFWSLGFVILLFLPNALITQFQLLLRLHLYDTQIGYILIMAAAVGVGPILLSGFIRSVPRELDEAAAMDGIGYWRYLFTFVVPLARPAIATIFILQAIGVWNDIILATILLPDSAKSPLTLGLFAFQGTYTSQWGLLAAATMIVAAPLVVAYVFLQRYLVGGVVGGAVKG
ncbi:carbohydrate ABC transporter permease [Frondihabitans australicus]|uniref:Carbohydrate ABC transporter membrane protein 2 (CUT1 family) n=1 Tax=Frondihabitans australicus TaxID=386892 RepID=A0A495ID34_9MICO|nr:carbohydrate ABC transporter permease [Frondihabitans australicus]RKR73368.1 carbohydrate ABC transporter membrane protein 2 (CUT1 family) [Frondihabitans australicus]